METTAVGREAAGSRGVGGHMYVPLTPAGNDGDGAETGGGFFIFRDGSIGQSVDLFRRTGGDKTLCVCVRAGMRACVCARCFFIGPHMLPLVLKPQAASS